jgi:aerobic-type carbon monoxide dehydrogenase small subunit (CoxS/CutS family)
MKIALTVNGAPREVDVPPLLRLLDALRGPLGLTGTKEGCAEGECGSCTVLLDGDPVNACLVSIGQCAGRAVTTVEGLGELSHLSPLQRCFIEEGGAQCGICTPGMLIAAEALLVRNARPTETEIREGLAGNLCRCTGYQRIVASVLAAADLRRRDPSEPRASASGPVFGARAKRASGPGEER